MFAGPPTGLLNNSQGATVSACASFSIVDKVAPRNSPSSWFKPVRSTPLSSARASCERPRKRRNLRTLNATIEANGIWRAPRERACRVDEARETDRPGIAPGPIVR